MASASSSRARLYTFVALLCGVLLVPAPAQDKKLSIYAQHTGYPVVLAERGGRDYVAVADVLEHLGAVAVKMDGKRLRVSFTPAGTAKAVDLQFTEGQTRATLRGTAVELASPFVLERGRGMVPVRSLPQLLARVLDKQIDFHEHGRRLFIGNSGVHYSVELKTAPTRLVLSFSAPVSPSIAAEPGGLRLVFTRDALVANGQLQQLYDHTITKVSFDEANGSAELSVAASVPLVPTLTDGGRSITVTPAAPPALSAPPATTTAQMAAVPALPGSAPIVPQGPKFLVVIDPAHGGAERGAALGDIAEKDFDLSVARRLRAELSGRGFNTLLLRDSDTALTLQQRALSTNAAHAAVYIAIHASVAGAGVRIYTSDVTGSANRRGFLPLQRVQAAHSGRSSLLAGGIVTELAKRQVAAASLPAPARPLNSVAAPAIALEIAPSQNDARGLTSSIYQQSICSAVGAALADLRTRLEGSR